MALTPADLRHGSGDQLLTYDTETNLEWLNLTVTYNRSYIDIQEGFGGFIGSLGFKFAKVYQISKLFKSVGVSKLGGPTATVDPVNDSAIEALLDLLGGRCLIRSMEYSQGLFDFGCINTPAATITVYGLFLNKTISPANAYADSGYGTFKSDKALHDVGAYLVRKRAQLPCVPVKKHNPRRTKHKK